MDINNQTENQNIETIYNKLKEGFIEVEQSRKKLQRRIILTYILSYIGISLFFITIGAYKQNLNIISFLFRSNLWLLLLIHPSILVFTFLLAYSILRNPIWNYKLDYKEKLIRNLIEIKFPGVRYNGQFSIKREEFFSTKLITKSKWDLIYFGDDLFYGKIDSIKFKASDIRLDHGNKKVFSGLVFITNFNKKIKAFTQVFPRKFKYCNKANVLIDDVRFQKYFSVYSQNQTEARYILSPTFMERITKFYEKRKIPILISFNNNEMCFGINFKKKHFEPSIWRTNKLKHTITSTIESINLASNIVHELKLNQKIWGA